METVVVQFFACETPPGKWGKNKGMKFYESATTGLLET